jgi:methylated-DNA-protein-cysteine methyltransferase-like protein
MNGAQFRDAVGVVVRSVPIGRVTTYGRIADAVGAPGRARQVGFALAQGAGDDVPAHRVVNRDGELTGGWSFGHPDVMRQMLKEEGVAFDAEGRVILSRFVWEPTESPDLMASLHQLGTGCP